MKYAEVCKALIWTLADQVRGRAPRHDGELQYAHLDNASNSGGANPASKEKRILPLSAALALYARRLPVLRFFGIDNSDGRGTALVRVCSAERR